MRDPRIDPKPGDVLVRGKRIRTVRGLPELRGVWVAYETPTTKRRGEFLASRIDEWRKWAANAEVLKVAE